MDDYQLRPIDEHEYAQWHACFDRAFHKDPHDEEVKLERELFDLERALAAVHERDGVVGTAVSMVRDLEVPGGRLPAAHVTLVSVAPTHRRRGLLTRLMDRQLADLHAARREPVALLWASEEVIYGRYGYGPATTSVSYEADTRELTVAAPAAPGALREVDFAQHTGTFSAIYDAGRAGRPGYSSRPDALWEFWKADLEPWRHGRTAIRAVLHERDGAADGYALYRVARSGDATGPNSTVSVEELVATDLSAYQALWRYLFSLDLTRRVEFGFAAPDEPLQHLVSEPRRLGARASNGLWVRIVDLPAALRARRYAAPLDVVLAVTDDRLPANTGHWRLRSAGGDATCEPTDAEADLSLDIARLGAAYLGGTSLAGLAAAGHVEERTAGAVAAASTAFGWHREPAGIEVF